MTVAGGRILGRIVLVSALLVGAVVAVASLPAAAAELLTNGGFENGLTGWSCSGTTGSTVTSPVHSGARALSGAVSSSDTAQCSQTVTAVAGTSYTLSGWVRGNYVYIGVTGGASTWTPAAADWTKLTVTFTAASASVQVYLHGWYAQGGYLADDVSLAGAGTTPPTSPPPTTTPPAGVPGVPGTPTVTAVTSTSIALSWSAATGSPTSYRVYEGTTQKASVTTTSATISGLTACTSHTYAVTAVNAAGESARGGAVTATTTGCPTGGGSFRAPIYVMPLDNNPQNITSAMAASGAKAFNLAFVLDSGGCTPAWNGEASHTVASDTTVAGVVSAVRAAGGDVSVSFGGYNGVELGATCGGAAGLAAAYQAVITRYALTRIDLDYEGDDLNTNMAVRMGAIRTLQDNARSAGRQLHVTLTVPMTTIGFPDTGRAEIQAAIAAGVQFDLINIMAFDYGLTNASTMVQSVELVAEAAKNQLRTLYGWDDATAWAHLGLQLMNGHTDQPSELFLPSDFTALLGYARTKHVGWFSYWSLNRDRACDPSVPHGWADGSCSSVSQQPYEFSTILAQYAG